MEERITWPGTYQSAAMVSIMIDAEYIWLDMNSEEFDTPKHRSMGEYGPLRGVERILNSLDKYHVKATFFVPAAVADDYPEILEKVKKKGHEIAMHGYYHERFSKLTPEEQREILQKGIKRLEMVCGAKPLGFRLPEGECTEETLGLIRDAGFLYDNSFFDQDVPYIVKDNGSNKDIVEIPIRWEMLDFIYFAWGGSFPKGGDRIAIYDDVLGNWMYELEASYNMGYCYVISFTPQIIGNPGRMFMVDTVLEQLTKRNIWVAKGEEIARFVKDRCNG